jgi:hypothetical protein
MMVSGKMSDGNGAWEKKKKKKKKKKKRDWRVLDVLINHDPLPGLLMYNAIQVTAHGKQTNTYIAAPTPAR